jgi:predicted nucleotidyltransferase
MPSRTQLLVDRKILNPGSDVPVWLPMNTHYEVLMGSVAYGVSGESSDWDIYGFCIPPKKILFPHLAGEIHGFGRQTKRFDQWQKHHLKDTDTGREYDFSIYNIVRYFHLCMENNPNMIDSLFVPTECVLHSTQLGEMVRENRKLFLHKGAWHRFKGYAYSQLHKMDIKTPEIDSNRAKIVEEFGYDIKFAYHVVRLMDEVEQILELGDIDLRRISDQLKSIRRGEWSIEQVRRHFSDKERQLEELYHKSELPKYPQEDKIKELLVTCLETHYENIDDCIAKPGKAASILKDIAHLIDKNRSAIG